MMLDTRFVKGLIINLTNKQSKKDTELYRKVLQSVVDRYDIDVDSNYGEYTEEDVVKIVLSRTGVNIPTSMFKRYIVHILSSGDNYVDIDKPNFDISLRLLKCISEFNIINIDGELHLAFNKALVELRAYDIASDIIAYYLGIYRDDKVCINTRDENGISLISNHGVIQIPKDSIYSARVAICDIRDRYESDYFGEAFRRFSIAEA